MESLGDIFDLVKNYCSAELSTTAYEMWIKDLVLDKIEEDKVVLKTKTKTQQSIIQTKYTALLEKAFKEAVGFDTKVEIRVFPEESALSNTDYSKDLKSSLGSTDEYTPANVKDNLEYNFNNFIVGDSNKFAHAASVAVATSPSGSYNPLFIYGQSGLGKTHLLFSILNEINKNEMHKPEKKRKKVKYVKGETFTNELINAIREQTTNKFHSKYREMDVLLMDDVQFIAGKERTQEEFFHTFETLYQAKKQIVLTSDRPPREIATLEERLTSRFESGLLADIDVPDEETRMAIIQRKSEMLGLEIPNEVVSYIAKKLNTNVRQLEGAIKKLEAYQKLAQIEPSIAVAQSAIRDILNDDKPAEVTVEKVLEEVSQTYSVSIENMLSAKRSAPISNARQIAMYVVREITQMSMAKIGEEFGNRDHSTVVYAIQQVDKKLAKDTMYREKVEDIIKNIRGY